MQNIPFEQSSSYTKFSGQRFAQPSLHLLAVLALCISIIVLASQVAIRSNHHRSEQCSTSLECSSQYMEPSVDPTFDIRTTEPPRYRAFRYSYNRQCD